MDNELLLQGTFLETLCNKQIAVSVYLINGIKLQGEIESHDSTVILLKNTFRQIVYKHAISTIVPSKDIALDTKLNVQRFAEEAMASTSAEM